MVRQRHLLFSALCLSALALGEWHAAWATDVGFSRPSATQDASLPEKDSVPTSDTEDTGFIQQSGFVETLNHGSHPWIAAGVTSAEFPHASPIPNTDLWWKFGGFIKGDLIHDFQPAGTTDRFVPSTIPTNGVEGQNTVLQAKATRLNLDVRAPSEWGTVHGFAETDFFTPDNTIRLRHAYVEVGSLLAGQTWTAFTDPAGIPHLLDLESPVTYITLRQAQFRWTRPLSDHLKWAASLEDPTTTVDDIVTATIPGNPEQPLPDFVTHLKYKNETVEWFIAAQFRDVSYRPEGNSAQNRFGWATNFVGILHPTEKDRLIGQFIIGNGVGRYRGGSDLRLESPNSVDTVHHLGGCVALTHRWSKKWSSTLAHSLAVRQEEPMDPPDTLRLSTYSAINLIWEPIQHTTMGMEYLYGTNETKDGAFGFANRIQLSVQYNFP